MFLRPARSLLALTRTTVPVAHHIPRLSLPLSARPFHSSLARFEQPSAPAPPVSAPQVDTSGTKTPIGKIERRLQITFTCTASIPAPAPPAEGEQEEAKPCHHRSTHEFSRRSYEKGIVLIECPGCGNRHLIADNLQWFSSTPSPSHPSGLPIGSEAEKKPRTVEQLMKEKGEEVVWVDGGEQGGTWMVEG